MQRLDRDPPAVDAVALVHHALAAGAEAAVEVEGAQLPWIAGM
ncbi:hypothetical protein [Streptomyces sp. NBC_01205]|nr:hypothetical protein OG573_37015 [Streptomyces sp. NBC_01205]